MTDDDAPTAPRTDTGPRYEVVHVERAFSAQPTLGNLLGADARVHELPLPEALTLAVAPDLIWTSDATVDAVHLLREQFPGARLLATVPRSAGSSTVVALLAAGADLVLHDEGVLLAGAALQSMARRLPGRPRVPQARSGDTGGSDPEADGSSATTSGRRRPRRDRPALVTTR